MLTGDLNLGHVEWVVQYRVKDPMDFLFKIGSTERIDRRSLPSGTTSDVNAAVPDTISDVSESVMRKLVGDSSIDYVLTIGREQLAKEAEELIQEELDSFEAGVDIITVKLQTTSPPTEAVQDAFQEVNRARQKKEQVVNEALGERNSKIPAARGAKDKMIAEAEGYQNRAILETTGKINAFLAQLAEYEKAPDVTRKRLYLEAMEEILSQAGGKTIIDESVRGVLPLLNLDQGSSSARRRDWRWTMKTTIATAVLVILGIAAIVFYSSAYVVEEGKQVIVTQFGKPVDDVQEAGLHFKTPFIQEAYYLEKRLLPWDGAPESMQTKDKKRIDIDVWARWRISRSDGFLCEGPERTTRTKNPRRSG